LTIIITIGNSQYHHPRLHGVSKTSGGENMDASDSSGMLLGRDKFVICT